MAETEAFLNNVMPTESVSSALVCALDSLVSFYLQDVRTDDVRIPTLEFDLTTKYSPLSDGVEPSRPPPIPIHKPSVSDLLR